MVVILCVIKGARAIMKPLVWPCLGFREFRYIPPKNFVCFTTASCFPITHHLNALSHFLPAGLQVNQNITSARNSQSRHLLAPEAFLAHGDKHNGWQWERELITKADSLANDCFISVGCFFVNGIQESGRAAAQSVFNGTLNVFFFRQSRRFNPPGAVWSHQEAR